MAKFGSERVYDSDKKEAVREIVKIGQHLMTVGTATCDVSNLILQASILRTEDKNNRAAEMLMSAAKTLSEHLDNKRGSSE
jgi:hypothetical protein